VRKVGWAPEWVAEYSEMMEEVVLSTPDSALRIAAFLSKLHDAVQAQRPWAFDLEADIRRRGAAGEVSSYAKSRVAPALISFDGRLLTKPAVAGFKRIRGDGQKWIAQELITVAPWEELRAKRSEHLTLEKTYGSNVALYDKLLALETMAPGSANPVQASKQLGIDLEEYLAA